MGWDHSSVLNIALQVDDEGLRRVRKLAIDKGTTVTQLVRDHLESLAHHAEAEREERARRLGESFTKYRGGKGWSRDEAHDRQNIMLY